MVATLPKALYPETLRAISIAGSFAYLIAIELSKSEFATLYKERIES